jgi:four helix bundle protein
MQRFTELRVWQRSHALALDVYRMTAGFPVEERFGLTQQIRRAVVSVVANIAEGAKRRTNPDYDRLLNIAEGSLAETEALMRLARDLAIEFPFSGPFDRLIDESEQIARMLRAPIDPMSRQL